jgi:hypothetical protein
LSEGECVWTLNLVVWSRLHQVTHYTCIHRGRMLSGPGLA